MPPQVPQGEAGCSWKMLAKTGLKLIKSSNLLANFGWCWIALNQQLAERVGFEPTIGF